MHIARTGRRWWNVCRTTLCLLRSSSQALATVLRHLRIRYELTQRVAIHRQHPSRLHRGSRTAGPPARTRASYARRQSREGFAEQAQSGRAGQEGYFGRYSHNFISRTCHGNQTPATALPHHPWTLTTMTLLNVVWCADLFFRR